MASNTKAKAAQIEEQEVAQEIEVKEAPKKAPVKAPVAPPVAESVYSVEELAENYKAFNTYREIVIVALKLAGKKAATFEEAKKIIDNFKHKEVK